MTDAGITPSNEADSNQLFQAATGAAFLFPFLKQL
jgi:hypothetical protein